MCVHLYDATMREFQLTKYRLFKFDKINYMKTNNKILKATHWFQSNGLSLTYL